MSMNVFFNLTTVTRMLNVSTQMVHLYAIAVTDIQGMVSLVKVDRLEIFNLSRLCLSRHFFYCKKLYF